MCRTSFRRYAIRLAWVVMSIGFATVCGCNRKSADERVAEKGLDRLVKASRFQAVGSPKAAKATLFRRLGPEATGIDFTIKWDKPAEYDRVFYSQNTGGGVTIGDYDGDGRPDIYLTRPSAGNRLYRNLGNMRFEDVTGQVGLEDPSFWGTGASFVDVDNDGDVDLYACGYACANRLYINENGQFHDAAKTCGLDFHGASVMMAFADYDLDGDLDGYLVTAGLPPGPNDKFRVRFVDGRPEVLPELREYWQLLYLPGEKAKQIEAGQYDRLFLNEGLGPDNLPRFRRVDQAAGIDGTDLGQAATWWDYDADGYPDLYVANDYWGADKLYHNNGDGTFTDQAKELLPHTPWSSMGVDVADINGDGMFDFFATDMAGSNHFRQKVGMGDMNSSGWFLEYAEPRQYSRNAMYLNSGRNLRFMEAAFMCGIEASDWTWTPRFEDFDNDGQLDLIITNGMTREFTNSDLNDLARSKFKEGSPEFFRFWREQDYRRDQNLAFRGTDETLRFDDVSHEWGFDRVGVSFGAATADLDLDGDLDIIVNNMDVPAMVYENQSTTGNRIRVSLTGDTSNRQALGAVVTIDVGGRQQHRYITAARGWTSTSELTAHFGLGESDRVDRLTVRWPSGKVQTLDSLDVNCHYWISEPERFPGDLPSKQKTSPPMFVQSQRLKAASAHREVPYDDYAVQPLLPWKLSQTGPGIACGDVNGDGRDDLYLGAAKGSKGQLLFASQTGYLPDETDVFDADIDYEDTGALFFDADGDDDLDLFVVSGGVECEPNHWTLEDRLYLNDGKGNFVRDVDCLPGARHSGSCVAATDYDHDGDLDLFVGGRSIPGQYPLEDASLLLRNDGDRFTDVTKEFARTIEHWGMVTGAAWSDTDGDGWNDLIVTTEWGPVRVLRNHEGVKLVESFSSERSDLLGWFHGVATGDLDADGDIDLVVTNCGWNTKYHATEDQPVQLFYGDFDGSGVKHLVEAEHEGTKLYPVRGRSCSTNAIPILANRFTSYRSFGLAELDQIYTKPCLQNAIEKRATNLASGVFINDGQGDFRFQPLPRLAQIAPADGVVVRDFDGDRDLDVLLVHNNFSPQRETGHWDGGLSLLLLNDGAAEFTAIWPDESGIAVPNDGQCISVLDVNGDDAEDVIIGSNNGTWRCFENQASAKSHRLRLRGPVGNRHAIGSRIDVEFADQRTSTFEVQAGSGYLSQSTTQIVVPAGESSIASIRIRWSDGTEKTVHGSSWPATIEIDY